MSTDSHKPEPDGTGPAEYGGPYHPHAEFNPEFEFKFAGAPEKQAQYQDDLIDLADAKVLDENTVKTESVPPQRRTPDTPTEAETHPTTPNVPEAEADADTEDENKSDSNTFTINKTEG